MHKTMYLKLAQELVELKQAHEEIIKEAQKNPDNINELRDRVEQLAEEILTKQTYFNKLLNPTKYVSL